jgi:3-hydroxyisobutyrate dehydrogenase-like beta-hydroxyacid dehydrogenase
MPATTHLKNDHLQSVGIIGLGIMGSAIASHLVTAGYQTFGYDPDERCSEEAASIGVMTQTSALEVAKRSDLILLSLPHDQALNETVTHILNSPDVTRLKPILIDLSTLNLAVKKRNHDSLADAGIKFFDCPISGTGAQAKTGDIVVYASGEADTYHSLIPLFNCFARRVFYIGKFGQGTKMKIAANLLVAIHNVATAEALTLAINSGLDAEMFCEVIASGAGNSRIFELRSPLMAKGTYTPPTMKLATWEKDMAIIKQFAEEMGVSTPLFTATSPIYEAAIQQGLGEQDTAAVFAVLQNMTKPSQSSISSG